jgi:hypothetical protein
VSRKHLSNKFTQKLITRIVKAGGTVEITAEGHLKVLGPLGIAYIGTQTSGRRRHDDGLKDLHRYAGIEIGKIDGS